MKKIQLKSFGGAKWIFSTPQDLKLVKHPIWTFPYNGFCLESPKLVLMLEFVSSTSMFLVFKVQPEWTYKKKTAKECIGFTQFQSESFSQNMVHPLHPLPSICWATNTPWTSTQGSRGSSAPSVRHDPNVASEALGWGVSSPVDLRPIRQHRGFPDFVFGFCCANWVEKAVAHSFFKWPFLLTFFTTFFQSPGKKHLRLRLDKDKSHPCKAQKLLLHTRARNEERLGEFIDDAGQNLMVVFFRFVFFQDKHSLPAIEVE